MALEKIVTEAENAEEILKKHPGKYVLYEKEDMKCLYLSKVLPDGILSKMHVWFYYTDKKLDEPVVSKQNILEFRKGAITLFVGNKSDVYAEGGHWAKMLDIYESNRFHEIKPGKP